DRRNCPHDCWRKRFPRGEPMKRHTILVLLVSAVAALGLTRGADQEEPRREKFDDTGFVSLFDGKTLKGWHVSAKSGHSARSKNKSGGRWVVEGGAITGSQDVAGNGGLIITDKQFGNF